MHAILRLSDNTKYERIFHAFYAVHDRFTHDEDVLILRKEDEGLEFIMRASIGYVQFGQIGSDEAHAYWTENIDINDTYTLFTYFVQARYDELAKYHKWLHTEAEGTNNGLAREPD